MLRFQIKEYEEYCMIADVFVKNKVNFLYGESGIGKTYGTIKALNKNGIVPFLIDMDDNMSPERSKLNFVHIDGFKLFDNLVNQLTCSNDEYEKIIKNGKKIELSEGVYVIDTYAMLEKYIDELKENDIDLLKAITKSCKNITIIILGHKKDIATKEDIPDAPDKFVNHCASKLYLASKTVVVGRNNKGREIKEKKICLEVKKLRGYDGDKIIVDWMRN